MSDSPDKPDTKLGRPRKADGPKVPYAEVDRALVFGEPVANADGETSTIRYPSYRELARRYGVSHSLIAQYSKRHDCLRRREQNRQRIAARTEEKLVELRAQALAYSRDDELRVIDAFMLGFEQALAEGRVRFDDPSDFNLMVRLKAFLEGGADSRHEVRTTPTLEELQARHRRMLQQVRERSGESGDRGASWDTLTGMKPSASSDRSLPADSPDPTSADRPGEVIGHPDGGPDP